MKKFRHTGYVEKDRTYEMKFTTNFEKRWGEKAREIAKREDVSVPTIHMRVYNYGTPYQRAAKPSVWEEKYRKTQLEIAYELDTHPVTLQQKLRKHGDCYYTSAFTVKKSNHRAGWKSDPKYTKCRRWLMPEHPDYKEFFGE
jgi:transposase